MKKLLEFSCLLAIVGLFTLTPSPLVGEAIAFTITNDSTVEAVVPLSKDQDAVSYYNYGPPGLAFPEFGTEANVGFFWLYEDTDTGNISLGMIFGSDQNSSTGSVEMSITGVPDTGFVALTDDSNELVSVTTGNWGWSENFTDGGVISGLEGSIWEITITANSFTGVDEWYFLTGPSPTAPSRVALDMSKPLVISTVPGPPPSLEERVEVLESQVETLLEQNTSLQEQVTNLEEALADHSHDYLTGQGEGHNNSVATSGPAVFPAAPEPVPSGR